MNRKVKNRKDVLRKSLLFVCILTSPFLALAQQDVTVTGVVTDVNDAPLPGVNIVVMGTLNGTVSDVNGKYRIKVSDRDAVLAFSFVGYTAQEIAVGDRTVVHVTLSEAATVMEEVVVVGYGVQKKVSVTAAISSVNGDELKMSSSTNIANALAGRISGLTSLQNAGGQPGADDATLYLRGVATLNGTSPLILIDGVPRDHIRTIDPNEVESVSVLKDASATAVFGVRGANGVILITTKRGNEGKPELSFNVTRTYSALTREPSRLHSLDYLRLRNEAFKNSGQESSMFGQEIFDKFENPLLGLDPSDPDYESKAVMRRYMYPDHDYYRELIARWTPQTVVNANLSGGTEKIAYFLNIGYTYQGGNLKTQPESQLGYDPSFKLNRYSFRSNVDYKPASSLHVFLNAGACIEKVNMPGTAVYSGNQAALVNDLFSEISKLLPINPGPYTIDGAGVEPGLLLEPSYLNSGKYLDRSPFDIINHRGYEETTRANLNSTLGANWDLGMITKGLSLKGMISFDSWASSTIRGAATSPIWLATVNPATDELSYSNIELSGTALSLSKTGLSNTYKINAQASLSYMRKFGLHDVGAMFLAQRDYWESASADIPYNLLGVVGRLTYNFDSRYFAEVNIGYNGSEQFAPANRFGFFPAASIGWVISNESFLKDNELLTFLKLRASLGRVGNDNIGGARFLYQDNISLGGGFVSSLGQARGVNEGLLGNPRLQWEVAQKQNFGIDFQLFENLAGSVDVFQEDRSDILISRTSIPSFQGLSLTNNIPKVNMGEVRNRGLEVELTYTKPVMTDMLLKIRGNFGYNRNRQLNVDEVPLDGTYTYRTRSTGFPIGQVFGYEIDWDQDGGYWTPDALADPNRLTYSFGTPRAGDFVYKDTNGDGDHAVNEKDRVPVGYGTVPRISWGASVNLQYKGFDVYVFFQGLSRFSYSAGGQGVHETIAAGTYYDYHRNAWTEERWRNGDKITYPALSTGASTSHGSNSFFVMDRTFARFKNAELGYTLPQKWLSAAGVSRMRIFVSGQNIFTWSPNYPLTHLDPEVNATIGYPVTKLFNFGVNITF
ncbi:MAG: TonB-dependent receptor [Bacteroidales bacterium]|jgi:TonB-linked SusC/RagA family outer membrane protein|nr:TonB-dependent receptor [Bacteroidales bacterium]